MAASISAVGRSKHTFRMWLTLYDWWLVGRRCVYMCNRFAMSNCDCYRPRSVPTVEGAVRRVGSGRIVLERSESRSDSKPGEALFGFQ